MPSQGPNSPSSFTSSALGDTERVRAWAGASNAASSNNTYATATADNPDPGDNEKSEYLICTGFGFSIPAGSAIDGILVEVEAAGSGTGTVNSTFTASLYYDGVIYEPKYHVLDPPISEDPAEQYRSAGGASILLSFDDTYTQINDSDFGVAIEVSADASVNEEVEVFVDHVRITVYYTTNNNADAPAVGVDISGVAPASSKAAASGQGLVDFTAVAPTQGGISANQPFGLLDITPKAAAALTLAHVIPQSIEITPLAAVPAVSWQMGDSQLLELTALAPTVTFRASSGQGLIDSTAPDVAGTQNAAAAAIGEIGFSRGLPSTTKAVASGQGLIDVTPVAAATTKNALHEFGRVWFAQPEVTVNFLAASGQGLIDVTAPSITPQHASLAPVVAAVGAVPAQTTSHDAQSGIGALDFVSIAPDSAKDAASGQGLIDLVHVTFASSHDADSGPVVVELLPVSPATTKSVDGLDVALVDLTGVAAAASHDASQPEVTVELAAVSPGTTKAAPLPASGVDFVSTDPDPSHDAAAGLGLVDLVVVTPATPKEAALDPVVIELTAFEIGLLTRKWAVTSTLSTSATQATLEPPATAATLTTNPTEATLGEVTYW
jgi:hypothetical protein